MFPLRPRQILQHKITKFLICGVITASFNVVLIYLLIDVWGMDTPFQRNLANVIAIEISVIFSFFVYRLGLWTEASWALRDLLYRQLPLYHLSAASAILLRICLIFPVLDWLRVNSTLNTLTGIALGSVINFLVGDRLIFKPTKK